MSDVVFLENGDAVDAETGEFLRVADIDDGLKFVAVRRHEAKQQEDAYKAYRAVLDQVIKKNQVERKTIYGDLAVSVRGGSYTRFSALYFRDAISEIEFTRDELMALAMAATGFERDLLPVCVRDAFDEATTTHEKATWIESGVVRKPAPVLKRGVLNAAV